jgi:hypothetical protein
MAFVRYVNCKSSFTKKHTTNLIPQLDYLYVENIFLKLSEAIIRLQTFKSDKVPEVVLSNAFF